MRWFNKDRQPEAWEIADDQPLGDIDAAHKIRDICGAAGTIAERLVAVGTHDAEQELAVDAARYQAAIKRALEIAMRISDDSMRDVSVSQIIRLCVKVDHRKTARVLLRAIQSEKMQTELVAEYPVLIDQEAAS
jgi:hypothetical protein